MSMVVEGKISSCVAIPSLQDVEKSFSHCQCRSSSDMKTKQIPANFHDWIKSQTFAICAKMAMPLQPPLGNSKRPVKGGNVLDWTEKERGEAIFGINRYGFLEAPPKRRWFEQ
jgi:hypothetical protein